MSAAIKALLATAALAASVLPAQAEDWRMVSRSPDHNAAFLIDVDSQKPGDAQTQRVRVLLVLVAGLEKFDAVVTDNVIDCAASRQKIGAGTAYDASGKVVSTDTPGDYPWEAIIPDSNYANVADAVCKRKPISDRKFGKGIPIAETRAALASPD